MLIAAAQVATLLPIIREKVKPDSLVYADSFDSDNALVVSAFKHDRINLGGGFVEKLNQISGIEHFWNQAKRPLRKFNGIVRANFHLYLQECEWRFNHSAPRIQCKESLINVCEAVSAAKVAALGEAKISEPKRSEDGTRRVSSVSCVQKAQFIGHK